MSESSGAHSADSQGHDRAPAVGKSLSHAITARPLHVIIAYQSAMCQFGMERAVRELFPAAVVEALEDLNEVHDLLIGDEPVDLVLFETAAPADVRRLEALRALARARPATPVAVCCAIDDRSEIMNILANGARGVLLVNASLAVLGHALGLILSGETYVPGAALRSPTAGVIPRRGDDSRPTKRTLTPRQRQITALLARGRRNKEIARELQLEEGTVKIHVKAILRALGVSNRTEVVLAAARAGYLEEVNPPPGVPAESDR